MENKTTKYDLYCIGGDEWAVFNIKDKAEYCICNSFDGESSSAHDRASIICNALNASR